MNLTYNIPVPYINISDFTFLKIITVERLLYIILNKFTLMDLRQSKINNNNIF